MFGFGKKEAPNETFNNILIASIGESIRQGVRKPSGDLLLQQVSTFANSQGYKINQSQANSIRACATVLSMSTGEKIVELANKMNSEMPRGEIQSYNELKKVLEKSLVISNDAALNFINTHLGRIK